MPSLPDITPKFEIKSIFVNQREIVVRGALMRPGLMPFNPWLGSSEFLKYLNLYVLAVDSAAMQGLENNMQIRGLANPNTRVNTAAGAVQPRVPDERWEQALTRAALNIVSSNKINMEEILQQQSFVQDALSAQETEVIPQSDLSVVEVYDTYFEISIPMIGTWWREGAHWPRISGLDLLAFFHFDLEAFIDDFGHLAGARELRLATIGGPMLHEQVLKYNSEDNQYYVPETREVFFLENGNLWSGLVERLEDGRYRAARPVGAPPGEDMFLFKRVVTNNKVKSSLFFDMLPRNHEAETLVSGNQYDGTTSLFGSPVRDAIDSGNINFGDELLSSLKAAVGFLSDPRRINESSQQQMSEITRQKMLQLAITREKDNNLNIVNCTWKGDLGPGTQFSWIDIRESSRPFYGSILCLNTEELIRSNSPFGYLFAYHRKLPESQLDRNIPEAAHALSESFITNTVANSRFNLFKIRRRRVTEIPNINNSVTTPESDIYDRNEPDFDLVTTRSELTPLFHPGFLAHSLIEASNDKAHIKELASMFPSPFGLQKLLKIEDYDLFDNVNGSQPAAADQYPSGPRFEYFVEIMIEDGIRKYLENKCIELRNTIRTYKSYVMEAHRPYIDHLQRSYFDGSRPDNAHRDNVGVNPYGNYNYSNDTFRPEILDNNGLVVRLSYESVAEARRFRSDRLVTLYSEILYVLSKIYMPEVVVESLKNSLLPSGGATLDNLNYFLNASQKLLYRLEEMTYYNSNSPGTAMNYGTKVRNVSSRDNFPKKILHIDGPTGVKVQAIRKNAVFFEPSISVPFSNPITDIELNTDIVFAERFFGLDADMFMPNLNVSLPPPDRHYLNRARRMPEIVTIASTQQFTRKTAATLNSRVAAAVEKSKTGPAVSKRAEDSNEMVVFNSLLKRHKGITFGTLLSKSFNVSNITEKTPQLKKAKKSKVLTDKQELAIFKSLVESESFDHFADIVEEKYKDFWFTKNTLQSVYSSVLNLISATRMLEDYKVSKTSSYKDLIIHPSQKARQQRRKDASFFAQRGIMASTVMAPYYLTTSHGLLHAREVKSIPLIYNTGIIFYRPLNSSAIDICPANNCLLSVATEPVEILKEIQSLSSTLSSDYVSGVKRLSPFRALRFTPRRDQIRRASFFTNQSSRMGQVRNNGILQNPSMNSATQASSVSVSPVGPGTSGGGGY